MLTIIRGQFIRQVQLRKWPTLHSSSIRNIRNFSDTPSPPPTLDEGEKAIFDKLTKKFSPSQLQVQDVSGGCGTFYAITISSGIFKGLPIVKQHKLVTEELKKEIGEIHGLQLNEYFDALSGQFTEPVEVLLK